MPVLKNVIILRGCYSFVSNYILVYVPYSLQGSESNLPKISLILYVIIIILPAS
jgi:hypothetical protein